MSATDRVVAVDLFCGAGGFSTGLTQACDELGYDLVWAAINHWEPAIETHQANHPDARQYHSKIEQLHPPHVVRDHEADALVDAEQLPLCASCERRDECEMSGGDYGYQTHAEAMLRDPAFDTELSI